MVFWREREASFGLFEVLDVFVLCSCLRMYALKVFFFLISSCFLMRILFWGVVELLSLRFGLCHWRLPLIFGVCM